MSKPWEETWSACDATIRDEDGCKVAQVSWSRLNVEITPTARLLAAAPELYRALASALHAMRGVDNWRFDNAIDDAEDALRKARGE